jgi:adenylate kinase family enzyme
MRIAIIGNSGSGKSTLAKRLAQTYQSPVLDLDTVAWEPGKIAVPRDPILAATDVGVFCTSNPDWIIEGCYASLVHAALSFDPYLLFLDPGVEQCTSNCKSRPWEAHKYSSKQEQDKGLEFLLGWVADYYSRDGDMSRLAHAALYDRYAGHKQFLETLPDADFSLAL